MSGGKACDKQADQYIGKQPGETSVVTSRNTAAAEDEVHASDHRHRNSMRLKDQPALVAPNTFAAALEAVPADDWCRTWAAGRTITLRRTSKRVKEVVDKMHLPAVVRLSRSFWDDTRNGTTVQKQQFVLRQLTALTTQCRISTLVLPNFEMKGQDTERLARELERLPALAYLNRSGNSNFVSSGAQSLAGVLTQCTALDHLDLSNNQLGSAGAICLAGVLGQCTALSHLNLSNNYIGVAGAKSLAGVLGQCTALSHLDLSYNYYGAAGAKSLSGVLGQRFVNLRSSGWMP
jgi:hypothetical protein